MVGVHSPLTSLAEVRLAGARSDARRNVRGSDAGACAPGRRGKAVAEFLWSV